MFLMAVKETKHPESDEMLEVRRRRYKDARRAGLTIPESHLFADSEVDVGQLRSLAKAGCPPRLIAQIVL